MTLDDQITAIVSRAVTAALRAERREDTHDDTGELLVSVVETARRLDVSDDTVRQIVALGDLDAVHGIGRGAKVTVVSLRRLVDPHDERPQEATFALMPEQARPGTVTRPDGPRAGRQRSRRRPTVRQAHRNHPG